MSQLNEIRLNRNKLTKIDDGTFELNEILTVLQLSYNKIKLFTKRAFPETIIELYLEGNKFNISFFKNVFENEKSKIPVSRL